MRLESIIMQNYRPYSAYRLDFDKKKETDLHAVIASNGVGKTSLLNAIEWCLYGVEPHLGDENVLPICNMEALKKAAEDGKDVERTSVVIEATEGSVRLKIERSVNVHTSAQHFTEQSTLKVFKTMPGSGAHIAEGEEADEIIANYLPSNIKEYFFFDSEQLKNYFGSKDTNLNVKNSIYNVAQISVVSTTREHLAKTIKSIRDEIGKINPAVESINKEIDEKENAKQHLIDENTTLIEQADKAAERIVILNNNLDGSEKAVDIRKKYDDNQTSLDSLDKEMNEQNAKLLKLLRKFFHPLMLYDINKATYEYINNKKEKGKLPPEIDVALVRQSLDENKCAICGADLTYHAKDHLEEILKKLEYSVNASNVLMEIKNDLKRQVEIVSSYKDEKAEIYERMKKIGVRKKELEDENKELQKNLQSDDSLSKIASWMDERDTLITLEKTNREKVGANKTRISGLDSELQTLNEKLKKANKDSERHEDLSRELNFATDALNVVKDIETAILSDVKSAMEKETMDLFSKLIWKKDTYDRITLTDSYQLELFTKDSNISCLGSCSAAETQLLALAFTIALHRVSGHEAPIVIDTPVGRVSDKNRENFAQTLVEVSKSKQIIMSFTPSEYSQEVSDYFDDALSTKRRLFLDNEKSVK